MASVRISNLIFIKMMQRKLVNNSLWSECSTVQLETLWSLWKHYWITNKSRWNVRPEFRIVCRLKMTILGKRQCLEFSAAADFNSFHTHNQLNSQVRAKCPGQKIDLKLPHALFKVKNTFQGFMSLLALFARALCHVSCFTL